jgi:hypothetical protein
MDIQLVLSAAKIGLNSAANKRLLPQESANGV